MGRAWNLNVDFARYDAGLQLLTTDPGESHTDKPRIHNFHLKSSLQTHPCKKDFELLDMAKGTQSRNTALMHRPKWPAFC